MDNLWLIPVVGALGILLGAFLERFVFGRLPEQPFLPDDERQRLVTELTTLIDSVRPRTVPAGETVLTEANRQRLVEELGAAVSASLRPLIGEAVRAQQAEPKGAGSLDDWYASRSIIPPRHVLNRTDPPA